MAPVHPGRGGGGDSNTACPLCQEPLLPGRCGGHDASHQGTGPGHPITWVVIVEDVNSREEEGGVAVAPAKPVLVSSAKVVLLSRQSNAGVSVHHWTRLLPSSDGSPQATQAEHEHSAPVAKP